MEASDETTCSDLETDAVDETGTDVTDDDSDADVGLGETQSVDIRFTPACPPIEVLVLECVKVKVVLGHLALHGIVAQRMGASKHDGNLQPGAPTLEPGSEEQHDIRCGTLTALVHASADMS